MKKILLILLSFVLIFCSNGCSNTNDKNTNIDKELSIEEKYDKALSSLKKNDYTQTVLGENYGEYYSDITEYKYVVDKDSKLVTSRISSLKYKTSGMSDYQVDNRPGDEKKQLTYYDFSTNRNITYDFQCGSGWNYYSMPNKTYTEVDSVYGMIVMMTKDIEPSSVEDKQYKFTFNESKIKEVTGEIFPTKDGNVSVVVELDETVVKKMTISYISLYGTGKYTVSFDEIGNQKIKMPDEVKNAHLMSQGQSCY